MYLIPGVSGALSVICLILWRVLYSASLRVFICIFGWVSLIFAIFALVICIIIDLSIEIKIYNEDGQEVNKEKCLLYNLKDFVKEYTDYSEIAFETNTQAYISHCDGWVYETFKIPVAKIYNKDSINGSYTYVPIYFGRYRNNYRTYEKKLTEMKTKELTDEFKKGLYKKLEAEYLKTKSS